MMYFQRVIAVLAFVSSELCAVANAQANVTPSSPLSLQEAISATLTHNPQLAGYRFKADALRGEQQTAALRPGYQLGTTLENGAGSGEYKSLDTAEFTLSLSSIIELGGQRDARMGVVTARQEQLQSQQRVTTMDVVVALTQQFIRVVEVQEQLKLQREVKTLTQETLASLNRQVKEGKSSEAELLRAKAALSRSAIELANIQQNLLSERLLLASFWGQSSANFGELQADLYRFSPHPSLPELQQKLANNPDLDLLAQDIRVREATLKHARSQGNPNLEWSAGVRNFRDTSDSALVLGLSVPLGTKSRASGAITTASAELDEAQLQQSATRIQLESRLSRLASAREQALSETTTLRDQVIPQLRQAMRLTADAFNRGRYSYLELNQAQRELIDAQLALISAAARAQTLNTEIDRLLGAVSVTAPATHDEKVLP